MKTCSEDVFYGVVVLLAAAVILFYESHCQFFFNSSFVSIDTSSEIVLEPQALTSLSTNASTHVYPYVAAFFTFSCLLVTFIAICLYGPRLGR